MSEDDLTKELLIATDAFRCMHRKLHTLKELNLSDMLVFGAVLHAKRRNLPPPKMSDIARHANLTSAAISQIADQLEKRGLVERYYSPEDRRTVYVRITEQGLEVFHEEEKRSAELMAQVIEKMGEEKSEQFLSLLKEFTKIVREV